MELLRFVLICASLTVSRCAEPRLSEERVVFQTQYGDIEMAFFPEVAPITVSHIMKLAKMGAYTQNHFFRVDKGFVAQVSDVLSSRNSAPVALDAAQRREAEKSIPGEFSDLKHTRGILSMGRWDDPDSATSSFSILLGNAPHLDHKYCVFGKVTRGDAVLTKLEQVETTRQGIFVMPKERITIFNSYVVTPNEPLLAVPDDKVLRACTERNKILTEELQKARQQCLP